MTALPEWKSTGEYVAVTLQELPAAIPAGASGQSVVTLKSCESEVAPVMCRSALPQLVTVALCGAEVVPGAVTPLPKSRPKGLRHRVGADTVRSMAAILGRPRKLSKNVLAGGGAVWNAPGVVGKPKPFSLANMIFPDGAISTIWPVPAEENSKVEKSGVSWTI